MEGPTPSPTIMRQASANAEKEGKECFCADLILNAPGHLRLGCRCLVHFHCLVAYIRNALGDRSLITSKGLMCPFRTECASFESRDDGQSSYYIDQHQLQALMDEALTQNGSTSALPEAFGVPLTSTEIEKFLRFMNEEASGYNAQDSGVATNDSTKKLSEDDDLTQRYINATTKPCPKCSYRGSHFHGHSCHHINEGCRRCGIHYCYRCLCSAEENEEKRGSRGACECGYWSNFCDQTRIEQNIVMNEFGYPMDKRCGCAICNECSYRKPCAFCCGRCVVCLGVVNRGPIALDTPWIAIPDEAACRKSNVAAARAVEEQMMLEVRYGMVLQCIYQNNVIGLNQAIDDDLLRDPNLFFNGKPLLYHGILRRSYDAVRVLLTLPRINVDERGPDGSTSFHICATNGELGMARSLLEAGAGIDAQDWNGWTPLYCACITGNVAIIRFLLERGAQVHMEVSMSGWRILHAAVYGNNLEAVQLIVEAGAEIDAPDIVERTPLHIGCIVGVNEEILCYLLERGADPSSRDHEGVTAISLSSIVEAYASFHGYTISKENNDTTIGEIEMKICVVCKRPFSWDIKWARCWDEVQTCSKVCKKQRKKNARNSSNRDDSGNGSIVNSSDVRLSEDFEELRALHEGPKEMKKSLCVCS